MKTVWHSRLALLLVLVASATLGKAPTLSTDPDFPILLAGVRERVRKYYVDLQRIAWTANVRQDTLKADGAPEESATELVYDTIIRLQQPEPGDVSVPFYVRDVSDLKSIDGKPVKPGEKPKAGSLIPPQPGGWLSFVLSTDWRTPHYRFSYEGQVEWEGRRTYLIDVTFPPLNFSFAPEGLNPNKKVSPATDSERTPRVQWQGDRFLLYGLARTGRLWIDAETKDVLQAELRTTPFEFFKPNGRDKLVFDAKMVSRFRPMAFENPRETYTLPESLEIVYTTKGTGGRCRFGALSTPLETTSDSPETFGLRPFRRLNLLYQ